MSVLLLDNVDKFYGKSQVLHGVSFALESGEILGFIGPNGAGKSTTMKCIAGLERYQGGSIQIMEHDLAKERNAALSYIGLSIESPGLYPQLSGLEHLNYFGKMRRVSPKRVEEMVEFSKLGKNIRRATSTYSMGMKQRLALALALLTSPKLLLLDEPANGLDPSAVFALREVLKELRSEGVAILYSSHQLDELEKICDRTVFIQGGKIIDTATVDEIGYRSYNFYISDREVAIESLKKAFPDLYLHPAEDGGIEIRVLGDEIFASVIRHLSKEGFAVFSVRENAMSLEDRYVGL